MKYNLAIHNGSFNETDPLKVKEGRKDNSLASLKKGQQITGSVIAVDELVTLDFYGQTVTTSKNMLGNVNPGDVKTFEVMKANENEIELRLLDNISTQLKTITAVKKKDNDWESILSKNEQSAKKNEQEAQYKDTKTKLDNIGSKLTQKDYKQLESEGFPIENFTIHGLFEALNRIKTDSMKDQNTVDASSSSDPSDLSKRLKASNLPITEDNLSKLKKALELSDSAAQMDDKSMQYLILKGVEPSAENIYKANYSTTSLKQDKLSDEAWGELKNQVTDVIKAAGYEPDNKNLADARWLIENKLPLTPETFTYKKNLDGIKSEDTNQRLDRMLEGMKQGIDPKDVSLAPSNHSRVEQIIADVNSISDEAIQKAVNDRGELTINRLATIQEGLDREKEIQAVRSSKAKDEIEAETKEAGDASDSTADKSPGSAEGKDPQYDELKARRQLEEIRLKMTLEAATKLDKKGFSIGTEELSKVVEELRNLEDNYYKNQLKEADADTSELSVQTLKDAVQGIDKLKFIPCSVLGSTLSVGSDNTLNGLIAEGSMLQAQYEKAGTAYEILATVPNREYGDNIKKAFANADSLLKQMNLEDTEQNKRAIRILGYNQMEITSEAINKVKAYDSQVTNLLNNLNPAVTVRMIKDGMNPLSMPVKELNQTIDQMREDQGITSEDRFSTYLNNLEKREGITSEERKAYIGIYRLLYNIDKSDGAALGSVIKTGREVTLGNLLSAIQTNKKGSLDAVINDEFGTLQDISYQKETIARQLNSLTSKDGQSNQNNLQTVADQNDTLSKDQIEYLNHVVKQIKEELTPQKLVEAGDSQAQGALQKQTAAVAPVLSADRTIWDKIKGIPVEKLLDQLQKDQDIPTEDDEVYNSKVQEIRELSKTAEQTIRFLNDYRIPSTTMNLMLANHILSNGDSPIRKLLKQKSENQVENTKNDLMEVDELSDKLIDKNSMQEAYEQLEKESKIVLSQACESGVIDSRRLAELKSIHQQVSFLKTLADREFYQIPIQTDNGITNMNLTIIRGSQVAGKLTVNSSSEQLGNIKAELSLKDQTLRGFFSSDNKNGLELLQKNMEAIESAATENNVTIKQMDFGVQRKEKDSYSYQNPMNDAGNTSIHSDTERILYRIAKAIVQTVRMAEKDSTGYDRAVS